MWIITSYVGSDITIFEFNTEVEAREALKSIKGYNVLTEVICPAPFIKKGAA